MSLQQGALLFLKQFGSNQSGSWQMVFLVSARFFTVTSCSWLPTRVFPYCSCWNPIKQHLENRPPCAIQTPQANDVRNDVLRHDVFSDAGSHGAGQSLVLAACLVLLAWRYSRTAWCSYPFSCQLLVVSKWCVCCPVPLFGACSLAAMSHLWFEHSNHIGLHQPNILRSITFIILVNAFKINLNINWCKIITSIGRLLTYSRDSPWTSFDPKDLDQQRRCPVTVGAGRCCRAVGKSCFMPNQAHLQRATLVLATCHGIYLKKFMLWTLT